MLKKRDYYCGKYVLENSKYFGDERISVMIYRLNQTYIQMILDLERFSTEKATKRLCLYKTVSWNTIIFGICFLFATPFMVFKVTFLSKGPTTIGTFVRLFSSVNPFMFSTTNFLSERLGTESTFVWTFTCMDSDM